MATAAQNKARKAAAAKKKAAAASEATTPASSDTLVAEAPVETGLKAVATIGEVSDLSDRPETVKVPKHRIRKGLAATGRGLRKAGAAVIDTDMRDIGQAVKRVPSHLPRIEIVRPGEDDTSEAS